MRALQGFAHRREHGLDRFLAFAQRAQRRFLLLPQRLPGDLQEEFVVAAQGLAGYRIKTGAQLL